MKIKILQIYFDELSKSKLQEGFVPYDNTVPKFDYYENGVIIDEYLNGDWRNYDYIGFTSWRLKDKTGLEYNKIIDDINNYIGIDVYSLSPARMNIYPHPFTSDDGSMDMKILIENNECLNHKIPIPDYNIWCNYWVCRIELFEEYVSKWLYPAYKLLKKHIWATKPHRNIPLPVEVAFLEGLFLSFLKYKNIKEVQIMNGIVTNKYNYMNNYKSLQQIEKQIDIILSNGEYPQIIIMSKLKKEQILNEIPDAFSNKTINPIWKDNDILLINGMELPIFYISNEDSFIKVCS